MDAMTTLSAKLESERDAARAEVLKLRQRCEELRAFVRSYAMGTSPVTRAEFFAMMGENLADMAKGGK